MTNRENQALVPLDQVEAQGQKDQPWLQIGDQEIYILSPLYRLRNSKSKHVMLRGAFSLPAEWVHRATSVVLALCNGKRTVADIARITRPLVKIADDAKAIEVAKANVKCIIHTMRQTVEERVGQPRKPSEFQAPTVLIAKADHDRIFGHTKFMHVEYRAKDFLPKDLSETGPMSLPPPREYAPASLTWHFTSECSNDCRYCYLGRRKIRPLPKERTLSLIEEAAALDVMEIQIAGGDFLLYPHLEDVLAALCRHKFLPATIYTKSFLSKEKAKLLAETASVIFNVQFSIDSTVGNVADYLVRTKGFCSRIFKSIDNALEAGLRVETKTVITPYNILTIPKLYRDLKKRGVSYIRLAAYRRSAFHHSDDLFNHPASFQWLEEQVKQLQQEFPDDDIHIQNGAPQLGPLSLEVRQKAWPTRPRCRSGRGSMMICTDGKVIPCEQMPETEEYFCGDVSYQSIQEVWDGDRLRELTYGVPREKFKGQPCYDCEEWDECVNQKGNCIRDLAKYYGSIYLPPPECPKHDRGFIRTV
jgi:radical SAM protein with 4Fe4S-binding SPASM domain